MGNDKAFNRRYAARESFAICCQAINDLPKPEAVPTRREMTCRLIMALLLCSAPCMFPIRRTGAGGRGAARVLTNGLSRSTGTAREQAR